MLHLSSTELIFAFKPPPVMDSIDIDLKKNMSTRISPYFRHYY